jgi:hypothetical protein
MNSDSYKVLILNDIKTDKTTWKAKNHSDVKPKLDS